MALTPGTRIGHYEILGALGSGGMGEVYHARDTRLDRTVAIKALPPEFSGDTVRLARFQREARLLASLNHPNVATLFGLEDAGGSPYLVLEFIEGESLGQRLSRGALSVREVIEVGGQVASAIAAAHERGVIHRDLKPGNIMLTPGRVAKVLDFGLAKGGKEPPPSEDPTNLAAGETVATPQDAMAATAEGMILGTTPYMSPEQARGKPVDGRTDVWAFGCVLFECLSGRQAFAGETRSDVIAKILEREPDWDGIPAGTPPRLRDLVRRCLAKDPDQRPRDIGDLGRDLAVLATEISSQASSPPAAPAPAPGARPSLAVLYFENLSSDPESEYFCAGMTEDILTDLSKIKGMQVASRNAVARYRGAAVDIGKVASDLNVTAVLEGSVRRIGDRVRITAQLINPADGFHLWAERYDRTLQDVFAVQEEIARAIAAALRVALSPADAGKIGHDRPEDVRAYDLYLKGREYYGHYTPESIGYALELFNEATEVDPNYALAFAGIADCYGQKLQWGIAENVEEAVRLGLEAARHAIALNPRLAEGYKAQALVLRHMGDHEGSRTSLVRAIEADPRYTPALINLAVEFCAQADLAASERLIRRALEVDPQDAFATLWFAFLLVLTDRGEEAAGAFDRLKSLSSDPFYVGICTTGRAILCLERGDLVGAERVAREGLADGVTRPNLLTIEAAIAARAGRTEEARKLISELESSPRLGGGPLMMAAGAALRIGEPERALRFMTRELIASLSPVFVRLDPELHPLVDLEPFAPKRSTMTLVWPLEAPPLDPLRRELFDHIRLESGVPEGSDVFAG